MSHGSIREYAAARRPRIGHHPEARGLYQQAVAQLLNRAEGAD